MSERGGGTRYFHGTRAALKPGDLVTPGEPLRRGVGVAPPACVYLTSILDEAIWDAEIAAGEGAGRVYVVDPTGPVEGVSEQKSPGRPSMSWRSREPLRVASEV